MIVLAPTNVWNIEYTEYLIVGAEKKCPPTEMESVMVVTL